MLKPLQEKIGNLVSPAWVKNLYLWIFLRTHKTLRKLVTDWQTYRRMKLESDLRNRMPEWMKWKKMDKKKENKTAVVNDASSSHFFIFLFFSLLVAPSSSPSFLLVPPSPLFLFLPCPALSQSLRIHKRPFFIEFDESVTDGPTNRPTNRWTDKK